MQKQRCRLGRRSRDGQHQIRISQHRHHTRPRLTLRLVQRHLFTSPERTSSEPGVKVGSVNKPITKLYQPISITYRRVVPFYCIVWLHDHTAHKVQGSRHTVQFSSFSSRSTAHTTAGAFRRPTGLKHAARSPAHDAHTSTHESPSQSVECIISSKSRG